MSFQAALIAYSVGGLEREVPFKIELENYNNQGFYCVKITKGSTLDNEDSSKHIKQNFILFMCVRIWVYTCVC